VENFGQSNGEERTQGPSKDIGFAGFTASQVDELFALFKEGKIKKRKEKCVVSVFIYPLCNGS